MDAPENNPFRKNGMIMLIIAWVVIFFGLFLYFGNWTEKQENPNKGGPLQTQAGELVLLPNRAGHYVVDGEINGEKVRFLLDTGATEVALSQSLAQQLHLRSQGSISLQTANGTVAGFLTRLDSVRLGTIEQHNVSAVVTKGMRDDTVLLGMSFLKRLEITQKNDRLILKLAL
jgi:aspartyl protease family protein